MRPKTTTIAAIFPVVLATIWVLYPNEKKTRDSFFGDGSNPTTLTRANDHRSNLTQKITKTSPSNKRAIEIKKADERATACFEKDDFDSALIIRKELATKLDHETESCDWALNEVKTAIVLHRLDRMEESLYILHRIIAAAQEGLANDRYAITNLILRIGCTLTFHKLYPQAESFYRMALAEAHDGPTLEDELTADLLAGLSEVMKLQGGINDAEICLRRSIEIAKKTSGGSSSVFATRLCNLGAILHSKGEFEEAESLFRQGLDITIKQDGNDSLETGTTLNNLSRVLQDRGKLAEAEPLTRRQLHILFNYRKTHGTKSDHEVLSMLNYSSIRQQQGVTGTQVNAEIHELKAEAGLTD
jgi:tetratricopeptide (TPR) repeat protein